MRAHTTVQIDAGGMQGVEAYRRRKDTAVLAIVFADVAGSTPILEEIGEIAYQALLEEHHQRVREVFEQDDAGSVVQLYGDGALAVFSEPSAAVERCIALKNLTREQSRFRLRIGVDLGQVARSRTAEVVTEVFGRQVNRAARIQALAEPDRVLVSFQIYDCAVGWLRASGIGWQPLGSAYLKGFAEPLPLLQAVAPGDQPLLELPEHARRKEGADTRAIGEIRQVNLFMNLEIRPSRRVVGQLVEVEGEVDGDCHPVYDGANRIGSSPDGEVWIERGEVSRKHAMLVHRAGIFAIAPLTEDDATLLNGEPTRGGELKDGDHVGLGDTALRFEALPEEGLTLDRQLRALESRIARRRRSLRRRVRVALERTSPYPAILWVDALPDDKRWLRETLEALGCAVDTADSTGDAIERLSARRYDVLLTDTAPEDDPEAVRLLAWIRDARSRTPTIVFGSPSAVVECRQRAARMGVLACTAGSVSLLRALTRAL